MTEARLRRSLYLAGPLLASMTLAACGDKDRSARAHTSVAKAEVSTKLPASEVSDEFLLATATAAAQAASVPKPVAVGVVVPPPEPPPASDNATMNQVAPPADGGSKAGSNGQ